MSASTVPAVELRDVSKSFGGVRALRGVSFSIMPGSVVGLVGDNGAGKSTLVKCISGMHVPDAGEILIDGEHRELGSPADAREHGVETVYQDLSLIDTMDVASNVFLNREIRRGGKLGAAVGWVDKPAMYARTREILDTLKIRIPSISQPVAVLSGGQRQAVALGRAVAWGRHIILLDEPEAALGVEQAEFVLELIATLAEQGLALLYISHNMANVMRVTDKVIVMRYGRAAAELQTSDTSARELVDRITGAYGEDDPLEQWNEDHELGSAQGDANQS